MQLRSRKIGSNSSIQGDEDGDGLDEIDVLHSVSDSGTEDVVSSSDDSGELSVKKKSRKKRQTKRFKRGEQSLEEKVGNDVINDENENKLEQRIEGTEQENEGLIDENSEEKVENDAAEDGNRSNEGIEDTHFQEIVEKKKCARNRKLKPVLLWNVWEQENERWIDENMDKDFDMGNQNEVMAESVEPPSELIMPLLRYQKEWLAWALLQEDSSIKGGILADEMGMGKTIQAIALVLAKREISRTLEQTLSLFSNSSKDLPMMKATLVICPVVAVSQWVREIERFTLEGSNKVLVYHGPKRVQSWEIFPDYDFVITTYSVVEADYRKHLMPSKYRCPYCSKLFYEKRLMLHLKYICGPDSVKTEKQSKQQTKRSKIQPQMSNQKFGSWKEAFEVTKEQHEKDVKSSSEIKNRLRGNSVLHSVKWDRIILDEAHFIKSRQSNTTRAILAISSSYRWALSGTPLQNRIGELYSLVRFLQIVPYSFYFCKDCDCRTLDHSSLSCPDCPHKRVRHFCWWNKYIATPIQDYGYQQRIEGERALKFLRSKILPSIILRRTKKGRAADLALPPRIVSLRRDTLDDQEEDYYESLYHDSQAQFNTFVEAGTVMNNFAHIFELLTRLRQAVNHPYLVVYSKTSAVNCGSSVNADNHEQECGVCHEPVENPVVTSCEHVFCKACLANISASSNRVSCPSCSKMLTVDLSTSVAAGDQNIKNKIKGFKSTSILNRIKLENFQTSTKIEALREEIRFMLERDGSAKGIVFSQFTSFLDLINYSLLKSDVACVQLNGSMTLSQRDDAIKRFIEDPDCKIFLMSLKAGGVALNLTVASHVFLMDPWWNPAVERQAQDRIHRIGQYKPIRVVRFIIENSIEERILRLQNKKDLIFDGTIGGSNEALEKLSMEDMRYLFT